MARRLIGNVILRNPESGHPVVFLAGCEVPDWAAQLITNPNAWEGQEEAIEAIPAPPVRRRGGNSGKQAKHPS